MESIIKDTLVEKFAAANLISKCQHGFVKGRSCLTNLLEAFENWTKAMDDGYGIDVIFLDYRKAFDTVPHQRLLKKLRSCGVKGKILNWIRDFLFERKMRVGVKGSFSNWYEVFSGVPQGSSIGPLLFLIFVNDLPEWILNSMRMFADDTKLWKKVKTDQDSAGLQDDLCNSMEWNEE